MDEDNLNCMNNKVMKLEISDRFENVKKKLSNLILTKYYCGICIEHYEDLDKVNVELEITVLHQKMTVKDLTLVVFNNEDILSSDYVCSNCIDKLTQSFIFIHNTKITSEVLNLYLNSLSDKVHTCYSQNLQDIDCSSIAMFLESTGIEKYFPEKFRDKNSIKIFSGPSTSKKDKNFKCPKCSEVFATYKELQRHKRNSHSKATYECDYCRKEFKNEEYLSVHYKTHLAVKCKLCCEVLPESNINDHLKNNHIDLVFQCDYCEDVFYNERALEIHITIAHKKNVELQCPLCLKLLKKHELESHKCRFTCPQCNIVHCKHDKFLMSYRDQRLKGVSAKCISCDFVCRKRETLLLHVNKLHLKYRPFSCKKCEMKFYSKVDLIGHLRYHKVEFECEYCDEEMNCKKELDDHIELCQSIKREHACKECEASFYTRDELNNHSNKHIPLHECEVCNKKFIYKSRLKYHIEKAHSQISINNSEMANEQDLISKEMKLGIRTQKMCICETCGKIYNNVDALNSHRRIHAAKVPCPECNKFVIPLKMPSHRRIHLFGKDPAIKPPYKKVAKVKCEYCDYVTFDRVMLEGHINRYHNKIKPYSCTLCEKDFTGRLHLKRHMECHLNNKSKTCEICSKVLANKDCLRMHMRLHTGEKPYPCLICGQRFRSSSIMNFHKNRVHAEKSIECPLCGNMFYSLIEVRRHVRKVHWKRKEKFNYKELEGLTEEHYYLFHDGRTPALESES